MFGAMTSTTKVMMNIRVALDDQGQFPLAAQRRYSYHPVQMIGRETKSHIVQHKKSSLSTSTESSCLFHEFHQFMAAHGVKKQTSSFPEKQMMKTVQVMSPVVASNTEQAMVNQYMAWMGSLNNAMTRNLQRRACQR